MKGFQPGISIVIPTEQRVSLTTALLERLYELRSKTDIANEVLVVDSSWGIAKKEIATTCSTYDAILLEGPANVRIKRNIGVMHANYSIILFLDSDCMPADDLLECHWMHYNFSGKPCIGGVLGYTNFTGTETLAWELVRHSSLVRQFDITKKSQMLRWGPTINLSVRREALDEIGLFDESFPFKLGGDDLDLTYRLTHSGSILLSDPNAIVYHTLDTWNNLGSVLQRALRWGKMEYYLYRKHPGLHSHYPPTIWGWLILVLFCSIIQSIIFYSPWFMSLPLLWFLLSLLLFSSLETLDKNTPWRNWHKVFRQSLFTAIPELVYQFGSTLEFIKHFDLRFFYSRVLLNHEGINGVWIPEAWNTWSNLIALLFSQSVFLFILRLL